MRVNSDPAFIGGKSTFCRMKTGIVSLTCAGVGVKFTAASKAPTSNHVEIKVSSKHRHYGVPVICRALPTEQAKDKSLIECKLLCKSLDPFSASRVFPHISRIVPII